MDEVFALNETAKSLRAASVVPEAAVVEWAEAAIIPDDAEVAWLDGWEFTNGTASLMLSPSFSAARIFIGAEATDAPVAGTFAADVSGIDAVALAEESDGWYTNTLSVAVPTGPLFHKAAKINGVLS